MTYFTDPPEVRVRGDWDWDTIYPAKLAGLWNGFAVPLVTREVAEEIVRRQAQLHEEGGPEAAETIARLSWDGDVLIYDDTAMYDEVDEPIEIARIHPNAEGLYDVGFSWCWTTVEDDEEAPAPGEPTAEQLAAFAQAKGSLDMWSGSREIRPDGVHVFDVQVTTRIEGRTHHTAVVGRVEIAPDGTIAVAVPERVCSTCGAILSEDTCDHGFGLDEEDER